MNLQTTLYQAIAEPESQNWTVIPYHTEQCIDYLTQGILCNADTNLEPIDPSFYGKNTAIPRKCRDIKSVYDFTRRWQTQMTDEQLETIFHAHRMREQTVYIPSVSHSPWGPLKRVLIGIVLGSQYGLFDNQEIVWSWGRRTDVFQLYLRSSVSRVMITFLSILWFSSRCALYFFQYRCFRVWALSFSTNSEERISLAWNLQPIGQEKL